MPRAEHSISRSQISDNAVKVLYRLHQAGFQACLVGGGVRDLLLGREPKDFDIATSASPEEVRHLFRNCRLIGRRFRLAHVHFGPEIIEVATFRGGNAEENDPSDHRRDDDTGLVLRDNVWGTLEEDAFRRDFTVNALFYNIADFSVVDYTGGMDDLRQGVLRMIGDPHARYREDPVRMLRAIRFAAKLGFTIDKASEAPIADLKHLLADVPAARLFEEVLKLFMGAMAVQSFELLRHYGLFAELFPQTETALAQEEQNFPLTFVVQALKNTDARLSQGKHVTPAFLYAALLWEPVRQQAEQLQTKGYSEHDALMIAGDEVWQRQQARVAIPRRFATPMREIYQLQARLQFTKGKRAVRLLAHPRFRAAYDFLLLRAQSGEADPALADWWTQFQEKDDNGQQAAIREAGERRETRRRNRRGGRRRRPDTVA
ncbi:MAG TPA: polynucleotide adenylyltransferase PcnB [Gammaproteobacteria bacterium]|nr:polynucleotide adenylyltransferase PcnB [Gammaproteobacteria bacterium]